MKEYHFKGKAFIVIMLAMAMVVFSYLFSLSSVLAAENPVGTTGGELFVLTKGLSHTDAEVTVGGGRSLAEDGIMMMAAHTHSYTWGPYYESTHKAGGHRVFYYCNAGDNATQVTGEYAPLWGCDICYPPPHSCTVSVTFTDSHNNGHGQYRFKCTEPGCTKGNYNVTEYIGNASWGWVSNGSEYHSGQTQHIQPLRCSLSGCGATQTENLYPVWGCSTCYPPPHSCTPSAPYTDSHNYSHGQYQFICTDYLCPYGNYNVTQYIGNASWSWVNNGSVTSHSLGHQQPQKCSISGCPETKMVNVSWSWQNNGSVTSHSLGHQQPQKCSYSGCAETRMTDVSWSWVDWAAATHPDPTQHLQPQKCSLSSCNTSRMVDLYPFSGCGTCYLHVCTAGTTTYYSENHPHLEYYYECTDINCSKGRYNGRIYTGNSAPLSWQYLSIAGGHNENAGGHAHYRECVSCGMQEDWEYVKISLCIACYPTPGVLVMMDKHFISRFGGGGTSAAADIMGKVNQAFMGRWDIEFQVMITTAANMASSLGKPNAPLNACNKPNVPCDSSCSGVNGICATIHHKNTIRNIEWMRNNLYSQFKSYGGDYNMMLMLTASDVCSHGHDTSVVGTSTMSGGYFSVVSAEHIGTYLPARVAQHELSHLYGAVDNCCMPGHPGGCIMTYGSAVTRNDIWSNPNIWCSSCQVCIRTHRLLHV